MRTLLWVVLLPALAAAERRITVSNAATPYDAGESFRVAPGSLIRVSWAIDPALPPVPMPVTARVLIQGSASLDATVLEVADGQTLVALVPRETPEGKVQIVVDTGEERSAPLTGEIVRHAFRIFTIDNGFGPARAENGLAHPARVGDVVSVWGTGLNRAAVTAKIAGASAEILYAGPAPSLSGVDQINIRIPENVPDACYTEVELTAGGEAVNPVTLTTGSAPCRHPLRLTERQLRELDAGRSVTTAMAGIYSSIGPPPSDPPRWDLFTRMESANVSTVTLDSRMAATYRSRRLHTTCEFSRAVGVLGFISNGAQNLSFGPSMRLRGPDRTITLLPFNPEYPVMWNAEMPKPDPVSLPHSLPPSAWTPGTWTLEADGSTEVPPFALEVPIGRTIDVANFDEVRTIDRSRDLTVRWNPEGLPSGASVSLWLAGNRTGISCQAEARDGAITIPRDLLTGLMPVPEDSQFPATLSLSASRPPDQPLLFQIRRSSGESVPLVYTQSSGMLLSVTIR